TSSIVHSVPRRLVGIWKGNHSHGFIMKSGNLVVHLLCRDQIALVRNFGFYSGRDRKKFFGIEYFEGKNGCPVLKGVHSYVECSVLNAMDGGDMTPFLLSADYGLIDRGGQWMTLADFYEFAPEKWVIEYGQKLMESVNFSMPIIHKISHEPPWL
ncbi:MAG: flavin reductase family protein, partial [Candidatus Dadabacteria bacterium]|nr:flavin reductase family protein [Candidatus Dadabacteria bacterium]